MRRILLIASLCFCVAACDTPTPPDQEQRPAPQVVSPVTETANAYKGAARDAVKKTEAQAVAQAHAADADSP